MKITDVEITVVDIPQPGVMDESPTKPDATLVRSSKPEQSGVPLFSDIPQVNPPQIVVLVVKTDTELEAVSYTHLTLRVLMISIVWYRVWPETHPSHLDAVYRLR